MPFRTKRAAVSHIRWWAIGLVTGTLALLAGAPAALAAPVSPLMAESPRPHRRSEWPQPAGPRARQIVLIAVGSALLACALTLLAVHIGRRAPQPQAAAH